MHVCLVTSGRPHEVFYGGEEKFTVSFDNWLVGQGHNATIVGRKLLGVQTIDSSRIPHGKSKMQTMRPRVLRLPYPIYASALLITALLMVFRILAVNRKSRISIIHAQDTGYGGLSAIISSKFLGIPVIITSHGVRYYTLAKNLRRILAPLLEYEYLLDVATSKRADFIITVSSTVETFFARIGVKKVKTIPVGIEIRQFYANERIRQKIRREFKIQNDVVIGFVGRFSWEKNPLTLLEAFLKVVKRVDRVKLILIGTGPLENELRRFCHIEGIDDRVIFTGLRSDVGKLLSAFDVFVLPSYTEGSPTALLEAMASGKAIIASDIPAVREIVEDDREAILFNPNKPEQLENELVRLYQNPKLRKKIGENARFKAKRYDANAVFPRIFQVYESVLSERSKMKIG